MSSNRQFRDMNYSQNTGFGQGIAGSPMRYDPQSRQQANYSPNQGYYGQGNIRSLIDSDLDSARQAMQASQQNVYQQQVELSNQKNLNDNLRSQAFQRSPSPTVRGFQTNLESENALLESRLKELEVELRTNRLKQQSSEPLDSLDSIENRYVEAEATNFLQKNSSIELQHLQRMITILDEENQRLKSIHSNGQKISESDVMYIKQNSEQIRKEIDEILRARASLNFKYCDLQAIVERLTKENQVLRNGQNKQADSQQVNDLLHQITQRNVQINEMSAELGMLKHRMNVQPMQGAGSSPENLHLRKEIDKKNQLIRELEAMVSTQAQHQLTLNQNNQLLSQQLLELKSQLDRIDTNQIKREIDDNRHRAKQAEDEVRTLRKELAQTKSSTKELNFNRTDELIMKKLEDENKSLQKIVRDLSAVKQEQDTVSPVRKPGFDAAKTQAMTETTAFTPDRTVTTVKKEAMLPANIDDLLLQEGGLMGEVSYEEMLKLEDRIKEFGDCNLELEDIIYKLKSKMQGTEYKPPHGHVCSNYSSNSSERKFSNKEAERFQKMLSELRQQVDRLSGVGGHQTQYQPQQNNMSDVVIQLERLMTRNRQTQESEIQHHLLLRNFNQVSDELMDLKDRHRQLEIKYNTLITVNIQNEAHIERLLVQIQDNKEYFKRLISDIETLKIKDRDSSYELGESMRRNNQLQEINEELNRRSASVQAAS